MGSFLPWSLKDLLFYLITPHTFPGEKERGKSLIRLGTSPKEPFRSDDPESSGRGSFLWSAGRMLKGYESPLHQDLTLEHVETGHLVLFLLLQPLGAVSVNDIKIKPTCSESGKAALPTLPEWPSQGTLTELAVAWLLVRHSPCGGTSIWDLIPGPGRTGTVCTFQGPGMGEVGCGVTAEAGKGIPGGPMEGTHSAQDLDLG